jgi:hypothetical protein
MAGRVETADELGGGAVEEARDWGFCAAANSSFNVLICDSSLRGRNMSE